MKSKVVTTAVLFAVMIAMTGIAAADQMNVYEKNTTKEVANINLPVSGSVDLDLKVSAFLKPSGTVHNMNVAVLDSNGNPTTGLQVMINELTGLGTKPSGIFPTDSPIIIWKQDMGVGGSEKFGLKIKDVGRVEKEYIVRIEDFAGNVQLSKVTVGVRVPPVSVPEFPSVALPVAAIMGLVFFFQYRKK